MRSRKFKAEVIAGHKSDAVEVPFDPREVWGLEAQPLWHGRRGYAVKGSVNGREFEGVIIPRQKRFYMLLGESLAKDARVTAGDTIEIALQPSARQQP